jgi:hypothetical protein
MWREPYSINLRMVQKLDRDVVIGGFYRHFKNKLYQVKGIAYHSETKEKMVVYQALYGDYSLYVRPFDMFVSEVDHKKYPNVKQKYRFQLVEPSEFGENGVKIELKPTESASSQTKINANPTEAEGGQPDRLLMDFLDIETYAEKLKYLDTVKDSLTDKVIDAMAASLDVEVSGADIDARYRSLKQVISAHAKFECTRLR